MCSSIIEPTASSPGMTQAHLDIYEKHGLAVQTRHLGAPIAYMFAESGDVNPIVHAWAYDCPIKR